MGACTLAQKGVGGSEEAVIHVSRAGTKRGWDVVVHANPPAVDLLSTDAGVVWRPWHALPADEADGSRRCARLMAQHRGGTPAPQGALPRHVWLQDIVDQPAGVHEAAGAPAERRAGAVCIPRAGLPRHAAHLAVRTSNGIDAAGLVPPGPNVHWRFMYCGRGPPPRAAASSGGMAEIVAQLLRSEMYAQRSHELGPPTLAVYDGFPRWLEAMHAGEPWYRSWRGHMETLLHQGALSTLGW